MMKKTESLVCAIILNWNGWQDTCECLASLLGSQRVPDTIVVVDNGSEDNSIAQITAWAESHFPFIVHLDGTAGGFNKRGDNSPFVLIQNRCNLGYAGGNNPAITWALARDSYEFIWILNNDTLVQGESLKRLLDCAGNNDAGIFGATVVFAKQPHLVQCAGGCRYNSLTTIFTPLKAGISLTEALQATDVEEIDYIYGASMFVRSYIFEECGLFSEDYFLFYEEMDFCKRAQQKGYNLHWCREAVVAHKVSQSVGRPDEADWQQLIFANYHENLSTLIFTWRFHKICFPLSICFRFLGKLAVIGRRGDWYLFRPLLAAYWDFIIGVMSGKGRRNMAFTQKTK